MLRRADKLGTGSQPDTLHLFGATDLQAHLELSCCNPTGCCIFALAELVPWWCGSPVGQQCEFGGDILCFSSKFKPASSVWVGKGKALEALTGVTASSTCLASPLPSSGHIPTLPSHYGPAPFPSLLLLLFLLWLGSHTLQGQACCWKRK